MYTSAVFISFGIYWKYFYIILHIIKGGTYYDELDTFNSITMTSVLFWSSFISQWPSPKCATGKMLMSNIHMWFHARLIKFQAKKKITGIVGSMVPPFVKLQNIIQIFFSSMNNLIHVDKTNVKSVQLPRGPCQQSCIIVPTFILINLTYIHIN